MYRKALFGAMTLALMLGVSSQALAMEDVNYHAAPDPWVVDDRPNQLGVDAEEWVGDDVRGTPESTRAAHRNNPIQPEGAFTQDDDNNYNQYRQSNVRRTSYDGYYLYDSRDPSNARIKQGGRVVYP